MKTTTRNCSYLFNPARDAVTCHSARHRSTFRLSKNATTTIFPKNGNPYQRPFKNCRLAFEAFLYWSKQSQAAIDQFIEGIEIDASLCNAEKSAVSAGNQGWLLYRAKSDKFTYYRASKNGVIVGGLSWQDLNERLKQ